MAYSFDGVSRVITITAQTVVGVRDIYSRWADWAATSDNGKYLPAFDTVGGQTVDSASGTSIPIYAFLVNGWKIRPQESSHTLNINDGVLLVQGGGDPFVNPLGSFVVRVNYQQPVQAITVATGGGGGLSVPDIWQHAIEAGMSAEQMMRVFMAVLAGTVSGAGTGTETFRDIADTKARVVSTVDAQGNRTAVVVDGT
jgi:hypothetical protein